MQTFRGGAAARQVELVSKVRPGLPVFVGDGDKIIQLLANLLSNAIKFTQPGKKVTVIAELGNDPLLLQDKRFRSYIKVEVIDEGIGVSKGNLEKIFEKFQQVEDSFTRREGGTGLGLSISKEIVLHHGGKIWAESTINVGSTFAFTLPCDKKKTAASAGNSGGGSGKEGEEENEPGPQEHAEAAG
jgi:signal transduction histidine kinase